MSGKGLRAALTVSAIIGALCNCSTRDPSEVLWNLNRVLHGKINGFATCSAVFISADGAMTFSNAGHLSPYLNGKELTVAGGLPLGVVGDCSYEEVHNQLAPGERLTFVSDGVVEATNQNRELFGFERTEALSDHAAGTIAETARRFGQDDDITVLTVRLSPAEVLQA